MDELFPNPRCELNYNKDYELLIAVMLSAQTKDSRVNMVTEVLFKKYDTLEKLSNANIDDIIDLSDDEDKEIKHKKIEIKPMNLEEAILQMELLGHNFFMYKDSDLKKIALVYKRKDGGYGVIEGE